ncbi:diflavin oxidoreductase [Puia dinghuensis]|uniref:assimilatory sulfite reductase (NADPH) n=1 Tax=Puia dinghuensis TaxID=1792502 RepID=A0A8J2U986_9BACT|nr:flavodoxin domain-containing protein [Puia dinghuensis]GGA86975.1 sulfite reductase [NADPH] flavoprotein alpha-component [Puia dinghuensis]
MLTTPKMTLMQELIAGSSREELIWLSGYLAGVVAQVTPAAAPVTAAPQPAPAAAPVTTGTLPKITIAYGTETGNAKKLATDFAARAKKKGIQAKLVGLEQYRLNDLSKEEYFFTVISTQGDGEPPAAAKKFYDHIHQNGLKLDRLKYSVLALGDTSYPLFCKAGEDVDQQLHKIGGQRILSLRKCDTDYEAEASSWIDSLLQQLNNPAAPASHAPAAPAAAVRPTGKKIFTGTVLANINLNDRGSAKQTHHLEITAEDVDYQPGDAIGIVPANPAALVEAIIALTGADADRTLLHRSEEHTLRNLLQRKLNIVYLPERVVSKYAGIVKQDIPETKISLLDLLKIYPVKNIDQFYAVVGILEPIAPRLYSISSSPEAHSGEIHLTVARDRFSVNGETKYGLCSDGLSHLRPGDAVEFYVHHNSQFRLPAEDKDVIMIGPGTGIAPFRSFLAERDSKGALGKNWLFFGDQHFTTDFLYQTEIQDWVKTGVLSRITTAFSRDQVEKVYVQHKMRCQATELYHWLETGAHVYLCGAKNPMSVDVEDTLLSIIRQEGQKSAAQAESYLEELKEAGRFVKDVY